MVAPDHAGVRGPLAAPEVGLDHAWIPLDVRRPSFRDLLAVVEHGDAVRDLHHHPHVVLDEEQGEMAFFHEAPEQGHEAPRLALGHARGRLVQQQQRRVRGEGPGQLEAPLLAVGQVAGQLVGLVAQTRDSQQFGPLLPLAPLVLAPARVARDHVPEGEGHPAVHAHHHVLDRGHAREEANVLKGAADAQRGDLVGPASLHRDPAEQDRALFRDVDAGEHVEEGGLARSVRPDDGRDVSFLEDEIDRVQGGEAAEALADPARLEQGHQRSFSSSRCRRCAGRMPCGRKIIMRTRMRPKIIRSYLAGSSWVGRLPRLYPRMTVPALRSSLSQSERPFRTWRFRMVTTAAPRIAPGIEPIPPRMIMASTPIDSMNVNDSGLMKICLAEKSTPTVPANEAPQAKARSFIRTSGIPIAWAAVWSSRIASHARPMWESSSRRLARMVAPTISSTSP